MMYFILTTELCFCYFYCVGFFFYLVVWGFILMTCLIYYIQLCIMYFFNKKKRAWLPHLSQKSKKKKIETISGNV